MFCFETWCAVEKTESKCEPSRFFFENRFSDTLILPNFFWIFRKARKCKLCRFYGVKRPKNWFFRKVIFQQFLIFLKQATLKVWPFVEISTQILTCGKENWFKFWCLVRNSIRNLTSCENLALSLTRLKVLD